MMHQLVFKCPLTDEEITLNIEWPDNANVTPPLSADIDGVCYDYDRTIS